MTNFTRRDVLKMAGIISAGLALDGCSAGGSNGGSSTGESSASSAGTTSGSSESTSSTADNSASGATAGSKVLVAYYSAQGHTKRVAEIAAAELGADLFEIVPEEVYTDADLTWTNSDSRVSREHDDESLRDVPLAQTTPDNWADYDTVLLGYPIWWAIAAWPTNHFASDNDFAGKKVIPFCTSASSGLGQSGQLLADAAGTGDWQSGQRFSSGASDDEVRSWAKSI
ncbi:flavodoxin [Paratractidigestivibacter sp.]|uniref:flavodoxin n=1 Tax=Paratractidigestivibacter sp. TaxID=2847316 RepID=UPI002AC8A4C1|nr:flavodoxin [Paratractidigestivibacter sp.]